MILTTEQKEEIKKRFQKIETVEHLAELLQRVFVSTFQKEFSKFKVKIQAKHLTYYAFKKKDRYVYFEIPKKNKTDKRPISAPKTKLKIIQKCINEVLNAVFEPHKNAFGFIPNKSVVDNAKLHVGKNFVYNIDIEGFFPSTEFRRVKTVLGLKPFALTEKREPLAFLIANLCCEKTKIIRDEKEIEISSLPQGAPTSPTLTNIVCQRLDKQLTRFAKRYGATYSRYADDITFSAHSNIFNEWFKSRLKVIIERQENYKINLAKERLQDWNKRQEVTGIIVNKQPNVNRKYIKDVRYWLRTWKQFGAEATQINFIQMFPDKKGFLRYNGATVSFKNYLGGKLLYLAMVRGHQDKMFLTLKAKFDELSNAKAENQKSLFQMLKESTQEPTVSSDNVLNLLRTLDDKGINEALHFYNIIFK